MMKTITLTYTNYPWLCYWPAPNLPSIKVGALEDNRFKEGLEFTLTHFEHQGLWPRIISTALTNGAQIRVYDRDYTLAKSKQSNLINCRINAYPSHSKEDNGQTPDLIFIDLGLDNFIAFGNWSSKQLLDMAKDYTLYKMKQVFNKDTEPSVLLTGNGYHIVQPVQPLPIPLESDTMFSKCKFDNPSKHFLKFVAGYLTDGKSDPNNRPSFNSCQLRIPGSFNLKCLSAGKSMEESQVRLIQKWNGHRPEIPAGLLVDFKTYISDLKVKQLESQQKWNQRYHDDDRNSSSNRPNHQTTPILWIEKLLTNGLECHRKNAIRLIIAPYLVTVRGLGYDICVRMIKEWLYDKCDKLSKLKSSPSTYDYKIKEALDWSTKNGWWPIGLNKLKEGYPDLYYTVNTVRIGE
jgi:hypothetical protein